jgi:hypothetical protein
LHRENKKAIHPLNQDKMTLQEKIQAELIGTRYKGVEPTEKFLSELVGKPCKCYDAKIADGADDDETEDTYVMMGSYSFEGSPLLVHIYYGDVTEEIGYVDAADAAL